MHHTFRYGQQVRIHETTLGDDCEGVERSYPAGALGVVAGVDADGVTIVIEGEIVNVFEGDECRVLEVMRH